MQVRVAYQGLQQMVPVTVRFNPFASIKLDRNPTFADNKLTVSLTVTANTSDANLEYRSLLPGAEQDTSGQSSWIKADRDGDKMVANLKSPKIPLIRGQDRFNLVIEWKDQKTGQIDRYPFAFELTTGLTTEAK